VEVGVASGGFLQMWKNYFGKDASDLHFYDSIVVVEKNYRALAPIALNI